MHLGTLFPVFTTTPKIKTYSQTIYEFTGFTHQKYPTSKPTDKPYTNSLASNTN